MQKVGKMVQPNDNWILKDITLYFLEGAKIGVLGLNGSGKSTLLRIMAGIDKQFVGEAHPMPGIRIGYLPQEPVLDPTKTVRGNVEEGLGDLMHKLNRFNEISMKFMEPMSDDEMNRLLEEQGNLQNAIDAAGGWEIDRKLEVAADALRLPPWDADVSKISGGERRRVALCKLLLSEPDMLLLDEPTNHLDAESVAWLEQFLHQFKGTVVAITHDRYFLDNVAEWILELDRGQGIPFKGNYSSWLEQKEQRLAQEERKEVAHQRALKQELEWVRQGASGRQKRSSARLKAYEELASREFQERNATQEIYIPPGERLGDLVIDFNDVSKSYENNLLMDHLSFSIPKGAIVGVIGPNGAGKTTLCRMMVGAEQPDSGNIRIGDSVHLAYVDQFRDHLKGDKTVWEELSDGLDHITVGNFSMPSRAYVSRFNFKGQDQQKFIKNLSGGERNRVHLAKLLKSGGNVLLLDEPTNDLDIETLRALEEGLLTFPGCVIVVSHDRWFLDRIATHIISFEGDSQIQFFAGNFTEFEAYKAKQSGQATIVPKRIRYKKITVD
jgi:ATP-binding cassette ChvD family protein